MNQESIINAIKEICEEKNISLESVIEAIEQALAAAYRKDLGRKDLNIKVKFDPQTGATKVYDLKAVVELKEDEKLNPRTEVLLEEAKKIKKDVKVGEEIKTKLQPPTGYGRIAAQVAKQVIVQKLREAERDVILKEYKEKKGKVILGTVQRREGGKVLVDIGKISGILPFEEQVEGERYNPGQKLKFYILEVEQNSRGPIVILSRTHEAILKEIFYSEIPEIASQTVEIKAIAREAGSRTKVAVEAKQEKIDPIGSCIGQRGSRIQTIITELGGEKIDIIKFDENPEKYIANALLPAKVVKTEIDNNKKYAKVYVKEDQLSLAIGRQGQNVRLASKLTRWNIDILKAEEKIK